MTADAPITGATKRRTLCRSRRAAAGASSAPRRVKTHSTAMRLPNGIVRATVNGTESSTKARMALREAPLARSVAAASPCTGRAPTT